MTDPISDMLTRIRNAQQVQKPEILLPYSTMKHRLTDILVSEGYLAAAEMVEYAGKRQLHLTLKYVAKEPAIRHIRRVSSPGRRVYVGANRLPYVFDNLGIAILSTSKGLMTNRQARKEKVGGEVLCEVF